MSVVQPKIPSSARDQSTRLERSRRAVASSGVPEDALARAEENGPIDWGRLATVTGCVFSIAGGGLGTYRFWSRPAVELGCRSPLDVLGDPGGPAAIAAYGEIFAHRALARRAG